ncbi:TonB-dependent receptor family protein [Pseudoxanthomonas mexicana]|uniref:TonB-dependent receptor family protein n=1 Tax=Pseudoxanthomonas mexicana TaxID=128785 RepID=UPI00398ACECD
MPAIAGSDKLALPLLSLLAVSPAPALAQAAEPPTLQRVEVTARLQGVSAFDLPASLDAIDLRDGAAATFNLSERLGPVPGLLARDRQNHAQDTQLSIRGFGARATFGVRGVRLLADGIPATMPDGQGQLSHFSLAGAERVEVMRGPFSALYGNSSGGVVQIFSAEGRDPGELSASASLGSDDARLLSARWLGRQQALSYALAASRFSTDGYRDHGAARRDSLNGRFGWRAGGGGELDLVINALDMPDTDDPLGLTRAQARENPRQATAQAYQFDTRKSVRQRQLGLIWRQPLGDAQSLRLMGYGGDRAVEQYLALPVAAQANPLNSGGVIDLDSDYGGVDARWSWQGAPGGRPLELTVGANADRQRQHRRGYENFVGTALGMRGALRRDERNEVENLDQFAQAWWRVAPRWSLLAGLRRSQVRFRSDDRYVTAANPDDSGRSDYAEVTPVGGVTFHVSDDARLYLSAGRGFETPTFNELGYRADGGAGLAFDLRPAVSRNLELGGKWRSGRGATFNAALFRADTDDELAVAGNVGGRSTFRNVGRARRQGAELAWHAPLARDWDLQLAWTWLDASFRDGFLICSGSGCTQPTTPVAAGARIPGTLRRQGYARLQWTPRDWTLAAEAVGAGDAIVNDAGSESAPGYALLHLEAARDWTLRNGRLRVFARIDNALDQAHIGSVIVNEGNGRYYEPGPDRGLRIGLRWQGTR